MSCLIAWSVRLRDSNIRLGGASLSRCDARRKNVRGNALLDPGDRRGPPVQSLDSRLDIGLDLVGTHGAPVDELRVGAAVRLRVASSLRGPERGVIRMEWNKI